MKVLRETQFAGLTLAARGKVRDIYDLGDKLLIVATDRLSAFDVILPTPIPDKGRVLTQLSLFWFRLLEDVIPNHVLSATDFPAPFDKFKAELAGRSMEIPITFSAPRISLHLLTNLRPNSRAALWSYERPSRCRSNASCAVTSPGRVGRTIGSQGRFVAFHCLRACTSQTACRSLFLRPLQKPPPAMTKTSLSNGQRRSWARNLPRKYAPSAWKSTAALPLMQNHAASSLPTLNSNLVRSTTNYSGSTK